VVAKAKAKDSARATHGHNGDAPDRSDLSRDEILGVASAMIERDGVDAFTMRGLAEALNRSTMATYRHVNNKEELLEAAADAALARVVLPDNSDASWNDRFHDLAMAVWAEIEHARWIPTYLVARKITTPNLTRILTELEEIVGESGLPPEQVGQTVVLAWTFTIGLLSTVRDPGPYLRFGVDVIATGIEGQRPGATPRPQRRRR
jgi:AcrR family transcriptional regulator